MLYPVYVHPGDSAHAHGAEVPDFPCCFSASDDWKDLPRMVQEAVEVWCMGEDIDLPAPTALEVLAARPEFAGGVWMLIDVDVTRLDVRSNQKPMRINISIPASLVHDPRKRSWTHPSGLSWCALARVSAAAPLVPLHQGTARTGSCSD